MEDGGSIVSRCQQGRDGRTPFEGLHGKKPSQEFVPFGGESVSETDSQQNPRTE